MIYVFNQRTIVRKNNRFFFGTKKLNLIEVCILIIPNIKFLEVLFILH